MMFSDSGLLFWATL